MDYIIIGVSALLVVIIAIVYLKLSKKINTEILQLNKKIDQLENMPSIKTNVPPPIRFNKPPINTSYSTPSTAGTPSTSGTASNYNNLKEQYDNYVQTNKFDNNYADEIPENIKTEIDNFTNNLDGNDLNDDVGEEEMNSNINYQDFERREDIDNVDNVEHIDTVDHSNNVDNVEHIDTVDNVEHIENDFNVYKSINMLEDNSNLVEDNSNLVEDNSILVEDNSNLVEDNSNLVEDNSILVEDNSILVEDIKTINIGNEEIKDYKNCTLDEINNLTLKELQLIARQNKLKIKGKKEDLLDRVKSLYNLNINMN
jgi:hypothetical protein